MRTVYQAVTALGIAVILHLAQGCSIHQGTDRVVAQAASVDITVSNNLFGIGLILQQDLGDRQRYAESFSDLGLSQTDAELFVCPGTGTRPGNIRDVARWTDYIYVGGGPCEMVPAAALVISPPENHGGEYGYVLFGGLKVSRLPADQVKALITNPCMCATNTPPEVLDYFKSQISVRLPERFRPTYGTR